MAEIRPEFQTCDRDELLVLCELLAAKCLLLRSERLAELILDARWTVAQNRVLKADRDSWQAGEHWMDLVTRPEKLTAARLAEREKAERRYRRLQAAARRAAAYERELWGQISAGWNLGQENVQ